MEETESRRIRHMADHTKGTILYIGNFIFPNKNAAAQRVVTIGKILKKLKYSVVYVSILYEQDRTAVEKKEYFGSICYEYKVGKERADKLKALYTFQRFQKILEENKNLQAVIAYNLQAFILYRLFGYCKKHNIKCIGDITEWYGTDGIPFLKAIKEKADIYFRMNVLHCRMNGNIVISDYLEEFYRGKVPLVNIPPLTDLSEKKWKCTEKKTAPDPDHTNAVKMIYAGSPSKQKERLDLIVRAVTELSGKYQLLFSVLGITEHDFFQIYHVSEGKVPPNIVFCGKVEHEEVIRKVSEADYSIIIRDKNRITMAGFPTKFVESISAGTPVITNDSSCLKKYIAENKNGYLVSMDHLKEDLDMIFAGHHAVAVDRKQFHYENYVDSMKKFLEELR